MGKAFLSHSSKDKWLVGNVAKKIGSNKCIYDEFSFEKGMKTFDEIQLGLENTDLFVFFISETALESEWVIKELNIAEEKLNRNLIKKFYPIIIDKSITYQDKRIPEWIRQEYNVKHILKHGQIALAIDRILREIRWEKYNYLKERDNLFSGRNELIKNFEEKFDDFDNYINCFIASGMNKIGRKSFLKYSLKKVNEIKEAYNPAIIEIYSNESIEDFIRKIDDLGLTTVDSPTDLINLDLNEKVNILVSMIKDIQDSKEIVFINDFGGIVLPNGEIVNWFINAMNKIEKENFIFGISAKFKARYTYKYKNIESIAIPELSAEERKSFFLRLLKLDGKNEDYSKEELKWIIDLFKGYPEQILYAYELLKEDGIVGIKNKSHIIVDYNTEKILEVMKEYSEFEIDILILLAEFELISFNFLFEIIEENSKNVQIVNRFISEGICDTIGSYKEYIKLNDNIGDYFQRANKPLKKEFSEKLTKVTAEFMKNSPDDLGDYSMMTYGLKEILKQSIENNSYDKWIIPSHFLKTMIFLYKKKKNYNEVINLAKKILNKSKSLDSVIENEIRYYMCLSLARRKDKDFLDEVQKIKGSEHNFLKGFYYRMLGKSKKSLEEYKKALSLQPEFPRVKREIVRIFTDLGDYDSAFHLAKELYINNKNNPHYVQAYLKCLMKKDFATKDEINNILKDLKRINTELSEEMYSRATAEYLAYYENNSNAIKEIEKTIAKYPNNHYPYVEKFDICDRFGKIEKMRECYEDLKKMVGEKPYIKNIVKNIEIVLLAKEGKYEMLDLKINSLGDDFPEEAKLKLENRVNSIRNASPNI